MTDTLARVAEIEARAAKWDSVRDADCDVVVLPAPSFAWICAQVRELAAEVERVKEELSIARACKPDEWTHLQESERTAWRKEREARAEVERLRMFTNAVLSGLRWMGDGYEWNPPDGDYRESPPEAVRRAAMSVECDMSKLRAEVERLKNEKEFIEKIGSHNGAEAEKAFAEVERLRAEVGRLRAFVDDKGRLK